MQGDLTTLDSVKAWIPITSTDADDLLTALISRVSTFIQSWLNRTLAAQTYTEVRNGQAMHFMLLNNYPIISVASLSVDGIAIPPRGALGPGTYSNPGGYVFDAGTLYLSGYSFCRGYQNVSVTYVAGFDTTPPDIEQATNMIVADWYKNQRGARLGIAAEAIEGQSISYVQRPMPTAAQSILQQYKKVAPIL